jgi:hypothetical protein
MNWALVFVAAMGQTPAVVSYHSTKVDCDRALRTIYETQTTPRGVALNPQQQDSFRQMVDLKLQYQREYRCLPVDKN